MTENNSYSRDPDGTLVRACVRPLQAARSGFYRSDKACPRGYCHREYRILLSAVALAQQSCRNSVAVIVSYACSETGAQMIIDFDSWEAGYADGRLGCGAGCPANHDELSYASGYREGRATRAEARMKPPRSLRLQRFKGAIGPVGRA
jgi:hypothetical protein